MFTPVLVVAPSSRPVSLSEAKLHLRVDFDAEDALIGSLIDAATAYVDGYGGVLGRALVTQTWRQDFSCWPRDCLRLPLAPAQSAVVTYVDSGGVTQTVDPSAYFLLSDLLGPFIKFGASFGAPSLADGHPSPVRVDFVAGYGAPSLVPARLRQGILLMVGDLYRNRDGGETKPGSAAESVFAQYRRKWL